MHPQRHSLGRPQAALSIHFSSSGRGLGQGGLGFTFSRGTHAENEALITGIEATLVSVADRVTRGELRGTQTARDVANRAQVLRGELGPLRQRVAEEDYDFTSPFDVDGINGRLKRMRDEVGGLVGSIQRVIMEPSGSPAQVAADTREATLVREKAKVQVEDEKKREEGFWDKYGLYVKIGSGVVGLGLMAYLFGPLVRGLGARAGARAAAGAVPGGAVATAGLLHGLGQDEDDEGYGHRHYYSGLGHAPRSRG